MRMATEFAEYSPECCSVRCVKSLGEIDEEEMEILVLLNALLLELSDSEDHVDCAPLLSEAALTLGYYIIQ